MTLPGPNINNCVRIYIKKYNRVYIFREKVNTPLKVHFGKTKLKPLSLAAGESEG